MRFAFLIHPLSEETSRLLEFVTQDRAGGLKRTWGQDLLSFCTEFHRSIRQEGGSEKPRGAAHPKVRAVDELTGLVSALGCSAEGRLYEVPMYPAEILEDPGTAIDYIGKAIVEAADWGAGLVGLGSMTGIVGGQGTYVAEHSPIPVTTGNCLTVYAAVENLHHACAEAGIDLALETVTVVGVPGSIASAAARLLALKCRSLVLVARRTSNRASELAQELGAELLQNIPAALRQARVVFSATSSGDCIEQAWLRPGSVVIDVGVPTDVRGTEVERPDVLVLSGGLARVPQSMSLDSIYLRFHHGMVPSCLAETMVLSLENRPECFSLGRSLSPERVEEIGRLARSHGFDFSRLFSFGLPLDESVLVGFRKALRRRPGAAGNGKAPNG